MTSCLSMTGSQQQDKTILIVDDHPLILAALQESLEFSGYQILTAHDGRTAFAFYAQHKDEIDLVITDLHMPQMDGISLINAIRADNSALPILVMSAYFDPQVSELANQPETYLLQKPFNLSDLFDTIREIIAK